MYIMFKIIELNEKKGLIEPLASDLHQFFCDCLLFLAVLWQQLPDYPDRPTLCSAAKLMLLILLFCLYKWSNFWDCFLIANYC